MEERKVERIKSKPPVNKVMTLKEAVSRFIHDGCTIAVGLNFHPTAAVYEICRQGFKDLTLVWDSHVWLTSVPIGLGLVRKVEFAYNWGAITGQDMVWRRAVERGIPKPIEIEEYSNYTMGLRFQAGAMGLPFLPAKSLLGSDIITYNPRIKVIDDPYGTGPVALVPACNPDVAIIHAQRADEIGNVQILGLRGNTDVIAMSSRHVIVTCEEIIPSSEIRRMPNLTTIPYFYVDAVVHIPFGGHYRECTYYYPHDLAYSLWMYKQWETEEGFRKWADEYVFGVNDWNEYCAKVGWDRLYRLQQLERKFQQFEQVRW